MTSRGRGRGITSASSSHKPVKGGQGPGSGKPKVPKDIQGLGSYLFSLNDSNFTQYGTVFAEMVIGYSTTKERLQEAVDLVYDTTVSDRDSANLGSKICEAIIHFETKAAEASIATEFRKSVMGRIQTDYKQRNTLRAHSVESWLGVFSFLCQVYKKIRVDNQPIVVMGKALLTSIEETLQKSDVVDDEIDCICTNLKLCGDVLESNHRDKVEAIFVALRRLVIKSKTSCSVRCVVLELIEYRLKGWKDPDKVLERFYVDAMADAVAEDELGGSD